MKLKRGLHIAKTTVELQNWLQFYRGSEKRKGLGKKPEGLNHITRDLS